MAVNDYPVDVRAERPETSSRGWAVLTILLIKVFALFPHFICLIFLQIAQVIVALIAQFAVAINGQYPPGMFDFVVGVIRWRMRVSAFLYSLTDRYPPFTLQPDDDYPMDVVIAKPAEHNRLYALFTVLVEIVMVIAIIAIVLWVIRLGGEIAANFPDAGSSTSFDSSDNWDFYFPSGGSTGLFLRWIAAIPHVIILGFLGIAAFFVWFVVQWVILFKEEFPKGMYDFVVGVLRWDTRVNAYTLGLIDRYPPFTFDPSLSAPALPPAAWYPDPAGRHAHRYWDGLRWTPHVADYGRQEFDPLV